MKQEFTIHCNTLTLMYTVLRFPKIYRDAQSDWFAKRGLPWHISVAIRRSEDSEHFESQTLVHVFQSYAQDSVTVASIMLDCLTTLKKEIPDLEMAYYKPDNAGCCHSGNSIISVKLAGNAVGVAVVRNESFRTLRVRERGYVIAKQQLSKETLEGT